jgi:chaperonin GroES
MFKVFKPLGDRVLIKRIEGADTTVGGIIIPDAAKEKAQTGVIVAVGQGRLDNTGKIVALRVQVDDTVYFSKYAGTEVGDDHIVLKEDEILGIVEK